MVKILSKSGDSLADTYDVEGSIAGIDQLLTDELPIVHEMGQTIFSERMSFSIRQATSGAINQSTTFDVLITTLPDHITRILGVFVLANVGARTTLATVSVREPLMDREVPIWTWNTSEDSEKTQRLTIAASVANLVMLQPLSSMPNMPSFLGKLQPQNVPDIAFRGQSSAFGAGTVTLTLMLYLCHIHIGGTGSLSSRGLPIPSW